MYIVLGDQRNYTKVLKFTEYADGFGKNGVDALFEKLKEIKGGYVVDIQSDHILVTFEIAKSAKLAYLFTIGSKQATVILLYFE